MGNDRIGGELLLNGERGVEDEASMLMVACKVS